MFALIDEAGRVCEFFDMHPGDWPAPQRIVDVSAVKGVSENWMMDGEGRFAPPAPPPARTDAARAQRDALLAACDWRVLADAPGPREAWLKYRAELRAVPAQKGFPHQVAWPEPPA